MRNFWSAVVLGLLFAPFAIGQGVGPHVSGGHLAGSAAGLDDGYSEANAFVPLWQPNRDSLLFADASFLMFNDGSDFLGGNVGGGVRRWQDFSNSIVGVYGYYDRRELNVTAFDQYGLGIESLGYIWDARLNLNVPIGAATFSQTSAPGFIGDGFGTRTSSIHGLTVLDAEVGAVLWANDSWQFRSFVGAYGLFDNIVQDTAGARGRVEARINDQCWIGGFIEHDRQFDTTGGATFTWRFGRGKKACNNSGYNVMARLGDPVQRRKHVAVGKSETTTLEMVGGEQFRIAHFVPGADGLTGQTVTPSGDGSVEKPFNSLAFIETSTADVIYIHPGVYEGASITVTQEGQQVVAASGPLLMYLDHYIIQMNPLPGDVVISNSPGNAITIAADDVSVQNFEITSAGGHGIYANNRQDLRIGSNSISGSGLDGIRLDGLSSGRIDRNGIGESAGAGIRTGSFSGDIRQNEARLNGAEGILVSGNFTGEFDSNESSDNGSHGIAIVGDLHAGSSNFPSFRENYAARNGGDGISIGSFGSIDQGVQFDQNVVEDNLGAGLRILRDSRGIIWGVQAYQNGQEGVRIEGDFEGELEYIEATSNGADGVLFLGDVTGDVYSVGGNDNGSDGVHFAGDVTGEVQDSGGSHNGGDGIHFAGDLNAEQFSGGGEGPVRNIVLSPEF